MKLVPVTTTVWAGAPAVTVAGEMEATAGTGFCVGGVGVEGPPLPHPARFGRRTAERRQGRRMRRTKAPGKARRYQAVGAGGRAKG